MAGAGSADQRLAARLTRTDEGEVYEAGENTFVGRGDHGRHLRAGGLYGPGAASDATISTLETDKQALQQQLASMAPTMVVQAGQLAPAPPAAQPAEWDTPESIRGRLKLLATYDSSGPDAWSAAEHPLVYFTSEGVETRPLKSGVQVIDAYAKKVDQVGAVRHG